MRPEDKSINLLLNLQHSIAPRQDLWLGIQERTHTKSLVMTNEIKALIIFSLWTFYSKRWVIVQMHEMPNSAGSQMSVLTRALKHALIHNCTHIDYTWLQPIFVTFCRASSKVRGTQKNPTKRPHKAMRDNSVPWHTPLLTSAVTVTPRAPASSPQTRGGLRARRSITEVHART